MRKHSAAFAKKEAGQVPSDEVQYHSVGFLKKAYTMAKKAKKGEKRPEVKKAEKKKG